MKKNLEIMRARGIDPAQDDAYIMARALAESERLQNQVAEAEKLQAEQLQAEETGKAQK